MGKSSYVVFNADLFSICSYLFIETESLSCKITNKFQKLKTVNMTYFSISLFPAYELLYLYWL